MNWLVDLSLDQRVYVTLRVKTGSSSGKKSAALSSVCRILTFFQTSQFYFFLLKLRSGTYYYTNFSSVTPESN